MFQIKYVKHVFGFCKYKTNANVLNLCLSRPLKTYSTQKVENTLHKIPGGRVSNVKKDLDGVAYFLLLIPISTFCLGTWQIRRKKWKKDLNEKLEVQTKLSPVPLPTELSDLADLEFRRVNITGEFDHSGEMYLGPRSCLVEGESTYGGKLISSAANGASGYYVVTPFIRSDTKERILVNRGWIPFQNKNPKTREEGQIEGETEITGIVRFSEKPSVFQPVNKADVRVWFCRDVEKMAELVDGVPVYLDAVVETTVPGGPIGGQTRASLRDEHLSYIITWYGLSAATAMMWFKKYIK